MPRSVRRCLLGLLVVACLGMPRLAAASPITVTLTASSDSLQLQFPDMASSLTISQSGPAIGLIGTFDLEIAYTVGGPPQSVSVSGAANIFDPSGPLHDTVTYNWALAGNSVTADIVFNTRSLDGISPPALASADHLTATGSPDELVSIIVDGGDPFTLSVESGIDPVPEPGTLTLIAIGAAFAWATRYRLRSA